MKLNKTHLILLGIILLAFFLRIVNISQYPMYGDELTLAYDGYSILKTGSDQTGQFLPFTFKMAGGHPPAYVYFSIPFIAIFGPTELGIRFLSILSGVGLVLLMFLFGKMFVREKAGLFAAILMAISPWDVHISRIGFETHFALFLTTLGAYLFLKSRSKSLNLIWSAICFGIAVNTYSTYKLTVPLLVLFLILYFGNVKNFFSKEKIRNSISFIVLFGISILLIAVQAFFSGGETRFLSINIFNQQDIRNQIIQKVNLERSVDGSSNVVSNIYHNKILEYSNLLKQNYLESFSTDFLFIHGDRNPRHNGSQIGELYTIEFLFLIFGLLYLFQKHNREFYFILGWLLIAPLPTALISEPHALRSSLMLSPLVLIAGVGFYFLFEELRDKKYSKLLLGILALVLVFEFSNFAERHYFLSANQFGNFFASSAKSASEVIEKNKKDYDYVLVSDKIDAIDLAYPTYSKLDPRVVIAQNIQQSYLNGSKFKKYDNVYIGYIPAFGVEAFANKLNGKVLYVGSGEDINYLKDYETVGNFNNLLILNLKK